MGGVPGLGSDIARDLWFWGSILMLACVLVALVVATWVGDGGSR